jgi:hypothetical protein
VQVEAAAVQVIEAVLERVRLQCPPRHLSEDLRHATCEQLVQAAAKGVVVEILGRQIRRDQQVDRLVVQVLRHQIQRPAGEAQAV